jgi:SAM-dependent methyltransferase
VVDARRWAHVADAYRQSFAHLCAGTLDTLLSDLGPASPCGLLDVGCGIGTFSRMAVEHGWTVTAADADADMVAMTRAECTGLPIRIVQAALPELGLAEGAFDAVVANFVINHLADPRAGVRELARVVRPGGAVILTTWTNRRTAQAALFADAIQAAQAVPTPGQALPPDHDFERTVSGLAGIARESGLEPVVSREISWDWAVAWHDLWTGISGGVASIGEAYHAQDPATRDRIREQMRARAAKLEVGGKVRLPSIAAYLKARRSRD